MAGAHPYAAGRDDIPITPGGRARFCNFGQLIAAGRGRRVSSIQQRAQSFGDVMAAPYWLGVDLGGTKILAGLFDDQFNLVGRAKQPTNAEEGGPAVFGRIVSAVDSLLKNAKAAP